MKNTAPQPELRPAIAAVVAFAALAGTMLTLAFSHDPTGHQLQVVVSVFGIAIVIALASVAGGSKRTR